MRAGLVFRLIAFLLLAVSAGAGTVAERDENGRIVVEFWHAMGSKTGRAVSEICERFNKSQEKYTVRPIYQGKYDQLAQKLIASLYAGRNPVVTQCYPGWAVRYFRYGYLEPVSNFVAKDARFAAEDLPDFYPVMIEECTLPDPKTGEQTLALLPFNKSVYVLYVNQTRLEKLGWKTAPKTWDEFLKLAAEMTTFTAGNAKPTTYGFATRTFIEDLTVQTLSAGTPLLDEATMKFTLTSPGTIAALEHLKALASGQGEKTVGYVESGFLNNAFGSERIGMYISSTASFPYNDQAVGNRFVWRAYRVPGRDAETPAKTLMQGTTVCVFANHSDEEKAGAWEFLKFLSSPPVVAKWAMDTGYMPTRRSVSAMPEFKGFLERDVRYANAVDTLEFATYEPRVMWWESVRAVISREVESVLLGRKTAREAMEAAEAELKRVQEKAAEG